MPRKYESGRDSEDQQENSSDRIEWIDWRNVDALDGRRAVRELGTDA